MCVCVVSFSYKNPTVEEKNMLPLWIYVQAMASDYFTWSESVKPNFWLVKPSFIEISCVVFFLCRFLFYFEIKFQFHKIKNTNLWKLFTIHLKKTISISLSNQVRIRNYNFIIYQGHYKMVFQDIVASYIHFLPTNKFVVKLTENRVLNSYNYP